MADLREKLEARWAAGRRVCVGLDPDESKFPPSFKTYAAPGSHGLSSRDRVAAFCLGIAEATRGEAAAFKINLAFFLKRGHVGIESLEGLFEDLREIAPGIPLILDAKFGDIGNTSTAYAEFVHDALDADAVTLNPFLGADSIDPFLRPGKGVFVLARTSNPGASSIQGALVNWETISEQIAREATRTWGHRCPSAVIGLVAGATEPAIVAAIRGKAAPGTPILVPGVGAQGGDLTAAVQAAGEKVLVNASRSILYASSGENWAEAAAAEAARMNGEIEAALRALRPCGPAGRADSR